MIDLHLNIDIRTLPEDEAKKKIDGINQIANHFYLIKSLDECKYCAENSLSMAEQINYLMGIAEAKYILGLRFYDVTDYEQGIQILSESAKIYNSISESKREALVYKNLGLCYWRIGDYKTEIDIFFKALYIFRELKEEGLEAELLNSIGNCYMIVGEYPLSLEYYRMSVKISRKFHDVTKLILTLYNMACVYANMQDDGKALQYFNTALDFNTRIECNPFFDKRIRNNIGTVLTGIGEYEKAEKIFIDCADYFTKTNNDVDKCDVLINMGNNYRAMGKNDIAEKTFMEVTELSEKIKNKTMMLNSCREFSKYYRELNDFKNAFLYLKKYSVLELELNKSLQENNIRKLNILHKVDITKTETAVLSEKNEELKSFNKKLIKLNDEKNYFLNLAANDLKMPLEKISAKINSIREGDRIEQKNNLSEILLESSYMQNIISDLLTINESESAK